LKQGSGTLHIATGFYQGDLQAKEFGLHYYYVTDMLHGEEIGTQAGTR
jgi:hypothetical protein